MNQLIQNKSSSGQYAKVTEAEDRLVTGKIGMDKLDTDKLEVGKLSAEDFEELVRYSNVIFEEAKTVHDVFYEKQKRNERYYLGDQVKTGKLGRSESQIVINKIFEVVDTLMPRYTSNLPSPQILIPENGIDEKDEIQYNDYMRKMEEMMLAFAEETHLVTELKKFQEYFLLYYMGVLKFGYDENDETKIWLKAIRPQRIFVPPKGEAHYVIEYHESKLSTLWEKFPKKKEEINLLLMGNVKKAKRQDVLSGGMTIGYYEYTTAKLKWWKLDSVILDCVENPHYDFKDKEKNHWKKPRIDYIFSDIYTLGMNQYSQTTIVDQLIRPQDALNKRKRQIDNAADRSNGVLVGYGSSGVTKEDIAELERKRKEPNGAIFLAKATQGSIQDFHGRDLPASVYTDMMDTKSSIDNIAGTHSTLRGEKTGGEETFGGRQLLTANDLERISTGVQMIERVCQKVYEAFAQLVAVHFDKPEYLPYQGTDGVARMVEVDKKLIKKGLKLRVRTGSTTVKTKPVLAQEAMTLWQQNALDPITLFERIGDPNPFRTAERLYLWQRNPDLLFKEASAIYKEAWAETKQISVIKSTVEAGFENKSLALGMSVPPNPNVTPQHLDVHAELLSDEQFMSLATPQVLQAIKDHMAAELAILKAQTDEAEKQSMATETRLGQMFGKQMANPMMTPPTGPGSGSAGNNPTGTQVAAPNSIAGGMQDPMAGMMDPALQEMTPPPMAM